MDEENADGPTYQKYLFLWNRNKKKLRYRANHEERSVHWKDFPI